MKKLLYIFIFSFSFGLCSMAQNSELSDNIHKIIQNKKATVGVALIFNGKDTLAINNQNLYPMMSVFKLHQSIAILDMLEKSNKKLDQYFYMTKADMDPKTYSPLRDQKPEGEFDISLENLLEYILAKSDNVASNYLFTHVLSPKQTELYIKSLGIDEIAIVRKESDMEIKWEDQYMNWTRPLAACILMEKIMKENILSASNTSFILNTLLSTTTGANKIKALLPKNISVAHKTGTSSRENGLKIADNDLAYITLPNGKSYSLALFVMNSRETDEMNASIIAQISKTVFDFYNVE